MLARQMYPEISQTILFDIHTQARQLSFQNPSSKSHERFSPFEFGIAWKFSHYQDWRFFWARRRYRYLFATRAKFAHIIILMNFSPCRTKLDFNYNGNTRNNIFSSIKHRLF